MNDLDRICDVDYIPSDKDLLLETVVSLGVKQETLMCNDKNGVSHKLKFMEIGGQRSERRKWKHAIETGHVDGIIFLVALTCYDEGLREDQTENAMLESLQVFNEYVNYEPLKKLPFWLVFNKIDLFNEKIKQSSIKKAFEKYNGNDKDETQCYKFIEKQFQDKVSNENRTGDFIIQQMNAIDLESVKKVAKQVEQKLVN